LRICHPEYVRELLKLRTNAGRALTRIIHERAGRRRKGTVLTVPLWVPSRTPTFHAASGLF
ncbi:MAG: hypothetical protein ACRD1J_09685, partial [Terriglobia bacterium]